MIHRIVVAMSLAVLLLLLQPTPATLAGWMDLEQAQATPRAVTVSSPVLQCSGGVAQSKDITWAAATSHSDRGVGVYSARVVRLLPTPLTVVRTGDTYKVTVDAGLLSLGEVRVEVTVLPGTAWAEKTTLTLGQGLINLVTIGLACP